MKKPQLTNPTPPLTLAEATYDYIKDTATVLPMDERLRLCVRVRQFIERYEEDNPPMKEIEQFVENETVTIKSSRDGKLVKYTLAQMLNDFEMGSHVAEMYGVEKERRGAGIEWLRKNIARLFKNTITKAYNQGREEAGVAHRTERTAELLDIIEFIGDTDSDVTEYIKALL